jgi:hypothetical protein
MYISSFAWMAALIHFLIPSGMMCCGGGVEGDSGVVEGQVVAGPKFGALVVSKGALL